MPGFEYDPTGAPLYGGPSPQPPPPIGPSTGGGLGFGFFQGPFEGSGDQLLGRRTRRRGGLAGFLRMLQLQARGPLTADPGAAGPGPMPFPNPTLPQYARGTWFHPGGRAIVGEAGPEEVDLPRGSRVTPSWQTVMRGRARQPSTPYSLMAGPEGGDIQDTDYARDLRASQRASWEGDAPFGSYAATGGGSSPYFGGSEVSGKGGAYDARLALGNLLRQGFAQGLFDPFGSSAITDRLRSRVGRDRDASIRGLQLAADISGGGDYYLRNQAEQEGRRSLESAYLQALSDAELEQMEAAQAFYRDILGASAGLGFSETSRATGRRARAQSGGLASQVGQGVGTALGTWGAAGFPTGGGRKKP